MQPNGDTEFAPAPLTSGPVMLRPIAPADYQPLRDIESSEQLAVRWRLRGTTPSPEMWAQSLWGNTLAQFLVVSTRSNVPVGIVSAHDPDFRDGFASLSAARFDESSRDPLVAWGFAMFVRYVFSCWNLHKLYLEVNEYNLPQFASIGDRFAREEGRLRQHVFVAGRRWDQVIFAIYRDEWEEKSSKFLERLDAMRAPTQAKPRGPMPTFLPQTP